MLESMARLAAMDVGTNSVLLLVAEPAGSGRLAIVEDRSVITRLGEGLRATGRIGQAGADRTAAAIRELAGLARDLGASVISAAGTMALRRASNADAFVQRVDREAGVCISIVSGQEEARLTYLGVRSDLPTEAARLVVFDAGGGSTELITGTGRTPSDRRSLEVGAVTLTERFLPSDPVRPEELAALRDHLHTEALIDLPAVGPDGALVGVGGTVTTMAAVHLRLGRYERDQVHGLRLSAAQIIDQVTLYAHSTTAERAALPGMEPARADVILAGALLVEALLAATGAFELVVSDRGLRHGLIVEAGRPGSKP